MASRPTGSDKVLEVQSGNVSVVIKPKNLHPNLVNKSILNQSSELRITGMNISSVKILGEEKVADGNGVIGVSSHNIHIHPIFFEQTDYEIIVKSSEGKSVSLWHENYTVRDKMTTVTDSDDLISGIVNFGNNAGFSEFEIFHDGKKCLVIRIEVFPSKISYKEDYQNMLQDISDEIYGAVLDFMRNTYREISIGSTENTIPALFFEIIKQVFDKFKKAANMIVANPHHKLCVEHPVVPAHKVKKIDAVTLKWLKKHPENVVQTNKGYSAIKAPTVKKQITYNTVENQFAKFILKTTVKKLKDFKDRYIRSTKKPEKMVLDKVEAMIADLNKLLNATFLCEVDDYKATQSMSLVFEMAPGYRELYKYYLMMLRGLSVQGDVFRLSLKDTAQLYEYWCFIKLVALLKKNYKLISPDVIKVDNTGVTITLVKGKKSEVKFINPRTGEFITLSYNPKEQKTQTVNQKPDNVLSLTKRGVDIPYQYVFDAKYRIENNPSDSYYPDDKPGPKLDDINTMHRYRDSIVYENDTPSRFMFEKTMFGAYVLFPYDDGEEYARGVHIQNKEEVIGHKFYNSIETVNIGGLPFLPGTTELVENFLAELVADSSESAFERASLPRGIEKKLAKVDWKVRDVLVGSVRTREQLEYCLKTNHYYVPEKYIKEDDLPIKYIALYEDNIGTEPGIRYVGEVILSTKIRRGNIPIPSKNKPDAMYYYFKVRKWKEMSDSIIIKDTNRTPRLTNKFLLDNCRESYQLFNINSEAEYRLIMELNAAFDKMVTGTSDNNEGIYKIGDSLSVGILGGKITVMSSKGEIVGEIPAERFEKSPRVTFNKIKDIISKG